VSCQKKNNTPIKFLPTVTTTAVSAITLTSVNIDGSVSSNGGASLSAWGVCWGTGTTPTLTNSFLQNNLSSGGFSTALTGLAANTMYYVRAYATNSAGTAYGNQVSFTTPFFCIGQSYQGGILTYILQAGDPDYDSNVPHGLIAAPSDQVAAQWGCLYLEITGAEGTAIGTGAQNTIDIMNGCSTAGIAARLCGDLVLGGYSDWYLPSNNELNKLYINRVGLGMDLYSYWSSKEVGSDNAVCHDFANGGQFQTFKSQGSGVRAIRAF